MAKIELLDFYAEWCGPCHQMAPIIEELEEKYKDVVFTKIDIDKDPDIAEQYGVMSMPTYIIKKDGAIVDQLVGSQPKEVLESKIQ